MAARAIPRAEGGTPRTQVAVDLRGDDARIFAELQERLGESSSARVVRIAIRRLHAVECQGERVA